MNKKKMEERKALMSLLFSALGLCFALEVSFIICLEWVWSTSKWVPWSITLTAADLIKSKHCRNWFLIS